MYFNWNFLLHNLGYFECGWVDPGVYAVAAPFVAFGWAFGKLADAEASEANEN